MSTNAVRIATPEDNPGLIELERSSPQGSKLKIYSERKDYFFRSTLYGNQHTLVAVDNQADRLIGVMAGTLKDVFLSGKATRAAFFYDLRLHPDYRRTILGRHMLRVWNLMDRWAEESGAALLYGLVKSDNTTMIGFQKKKQNYRFTGKMIVLSRPVFKLKPLRLQPQELTPEEANTYLTGKVWDRYGNYQFFPTALKDRYLTPAMSDSGLFSCFVLEQGSSFASIGFFRVCRAMWTRVIRLPGYYKVLKPIFDGLRFVLPLPRLPQQGGRICYCHVFNHLADGPQGLRLWRQLLIHANNLAYQEGATLLTSAFDQSDSFLLHFQRGSLNRIEYLLGYKPFVRGVPEVHTPYYPDMRDMN
ncbi:MAG: GNAT family N-acetyltransferase [Spirochaetaceae bacterium]|nr:MAG: GNAT family N-acetyltransferase [Spirochaetaceae bacterium]